MKLTYKKLLPLILGLGCASGFSAISWIGPTTVNAVAANTNLQGTTDPNSAWAGITIDMESDVAAREFRFNPNNPSQIRFKPTNALGTGESITFSFEFNMQLFTGPKITGQTPPARVGGSARINALTNLDVDLAVTMSGGNDTLQNYFGPNAPVNGDTEATNPDIAYFNPTEGFNDAAVVGEADFAPASFVNGATFDSFSNGGNTMNFTESPTGSIAVTLGDSQVTRNTTDFSADKWEYTFTNNSATSIAAGSLFLFTFEGSNLAAQTAALIPEPTSFSLFGLGAFGLLLRRKR